MGGRVALKKSKPEQILSVRTNLIDITLLSGSLHYFRIPREYWRDRLEKVRAAGLNAVQIYVEWSFHEVKRREYNFQGYFLKLISKKFFSFVKQM